VHIPQNLRVTSKIGQLSLPISDLDLSPYYLVINKNYILVSPKPPESKEALSVRMIKPEVEKVPEKPVKLKPVPPEKGDALSGRMLKKESFIENASIYAND